VRLRACASVFSARARYCVRTRFCVRAFTCACVCARARFCACGKEMGPTNNLGFDIAHLSVKECFFHWDTVIYLNFICNAWKLTAKPFAS
jgi:hypothetical protein